MSTNRKLQAEIDRVLKRIQEGITEFGQIWEKVEQAPNQNLKEKYEADLKKEIKKLQRYRDQVKSWASSNDIKNKKPLLDARKAIETEMERFKVLEKETKTKAYSKEGLNSGLKKKDDKNAPKAKQIEWIDEIVEKMQTLLSDFESKMETIKGNKKKKDDDEMKRIVNLMERLTWHVEQLGIAKRRLEDDKISAGKVEKIKDDVQNYLDNFEDPDFFEDELLYEALNDEDGDGKKEDEEEEVESDPERLEEPEETNEEEEEEEEEKAEKTKTKKGKPSPTGSPTLNATSSKKQKSGEKEKDKPKESKEKTGTEKEKSSKTSSASSKTGKDTATPKTAIKPPEVVKEKEKSGKTSSGSKVSGTPSKPPKTPEAGPTTAAPGSVLGLGIGTGQSAAQIAGKTAAKPSVTTTPAKTMASILTKGKDEAAGTRASISASSTAVSSSSSTSSQSSATILSTASMTSQTFSTAASVVSSSSSLPSVSNSPPSSQSPTPPQPLQSQTSNNGTAPKPPAAKAGVTNSTPRKPKKGTEEQSSTTPSPIIRGSSGTLPALSGHDPSPGPSSAGINTEAAAAIGQRPLSLGASGRSRTAPQGNQVPSNTFDNSPPATDSPGANVPSVPLPVQRSASQATPTTIISATGATTQERTEYRSQLKLLEPSLRNLPDPNDSERPKTYVPRNPYRTPACFPSQPAAIFDDPAIFEKFGTDTLFFIFYFQQGTPHQYLAARELKKQSWRYHKNFLTWFQRHDDPKHTTDEYEQGTYVYFDYETGWCQRIKTDFTFEYRHLEDELSVPTANNL